MNLTFDQDSKLLIVVDVPPEYADTIVAFGFERQENEFRRRIGGDSSVAGAAVARYATVLEDMVLQYLGRRPMPWQDALTTFLSRVAPSNRWALIGGAALAVQGVEVRPGDVDVIAEVDVALGFDELFGDCLIEPTAHGPGFGWFDRAFPRARLEWLGNPRESKGVWALGTVDMEIVEWRGYELLVPPLEVYLRIEEARGRTDRVESIKRVIEDRPAS